MTDEKPIEPIEPTDGSSSGAELRAYYLSLDELLDGARAGRRSCIGELRRRFGAHLYRGITGLAPNAASEIVDDVFLKLPRLLQSYEERGKFDAWLRQVARHMARTAARSQQARDERHTGFDEHDAAKGGEPAFEQLQLQEQLLACLTDTQRNVWMLSLEGYSHKEIAEREGISVANSQKILERARKALVAEYQRLAE